MKKTFRPTEELSTIAGAARIVGRKATAITQAIERGRIDTVTLACGQRVVVLASVVAWNERGSKPGRKVAANKTRR